MGSTQEMENAVSVIFYTAYTSADLFLMELLY